MFLDYNEMCNSETQKRKHITMQVTMPDEEFLCLRYVVYVPVGAMVQVYEVKGFVCGFTWLLGLRLSSLQEEYIRSEKW